MAQGRDDFWFSLASNGIGVPKSVLPDFTTYEDEFSEILEAASKFDVRDTSSELQHEFWNQIILNAQTGHGPRIACDSASTTFCYASPGFPCQPPPLDSDIYFPGSYPAHKTAIEKALAFLSLPRIPSLFIWCKTAHPQEQSVALSISEPLASTLDRTSLVSSSSPGAVAVQHLADVGTFSDVLNVSSPPFPTGSRYYTPNGSIVVFRTSHDWT
ncbi:hypothetical protein H4582DRAFT_2060472 [Lactarius indigo]|nr:hypothetical protein H4582DRAFT_2060472 [Lactarius indigo]